METCGCTNQDDSPSQMFHCLVDHQILDFTHQSMRFYGTMTDETLKVYLNYIDEYKKVAELRKQLEDINADLRRSLAQLRLLQGEVYSTFNMD